MRINKFICLVVASCVFFGCKDKNNYPSMVVKNSYEEGYWTGYYAFVRQSELDIPSPKLIRYSSFTEENKEDLLIGYVDGYHKATESVRYPHCR